MSTPKLIVDLHTHLFNARYLPLANVIANAMGKDRSRIADALGWLLNLLTDSSALQKLGDRSDYIDMICEVVIAEMHVEENVFSVFPSELSEKAVLRAVKKSELFKCLIKMEKAIRENSKDKLSSASSSLNKLSDLDEWAKRIVKKAIQIVIKAMDITPWGVKENIVKFFFTMLRSEADLLKQLEQSYGDNLPAKVQFVHLLIDISKAYKYPKEPYYRFPEVHLQRMQELKRQNSWKLIGFFPFDPRRENWMEIANTALEKGFSGFKFYPAMGYLPIGNNDPHEIERPDPEVEDRVLAFFKFCVKRDKPILTHCSPRVFQTREKLGRYSHPKYWLKLLEEHPELSEIRLCLGHGGGGRDPKRKPPIPIESHGWMATNDLQWTDKKNYVCGVIELCRRFPNIYCDISYLTELLEVDIIDGRTPADIFKSNLKSTISAPADYECQFLDKIAYGSDWHMVSVVDQQNTRKYLDLLLEVFRDPELMKYCDSFFWRNAYKYLGYY